MKEGLVSIIIPVYNAEDFLTETIESVQALHDIYLLTNSLPKLFRSL